MPRINRRNSVRRVEVKLGDLSIVEQLMFGSGPVHGFTGCDTITSQELLEEVYSANREEIISQHVASRPGSRPWATWCFDLLPADPRRKVERDPELPATCLDAAMGDPWESSDGFESAYRYLTRRQLLAAGELAQLRAKRDCRQLLESHRMMIEQTAPPYRDNVRLPGWELADLAAIFGTEHFDADELRRAEQYRSPSNGKH